MTQENQDPDKTREVHSPRARPRPQSDGSPMDGPTREIRVSQSRDPGPNPTPHSNRAEPAPWWQSVNRDRRQPPVEAREKLARERVDTPAYQVQPRASKPTRNLKSRTRLLTYGGLALAVSVAASAGLALGKGTRPSRKVLDLTTAREGVAQVLVDPVTGYGATSVTSVACNEGRNPEVQEGNSFVCDVVVDGTPRKVTVVFQDDAGTYAVDRPR